MTKQMSSKSLCVLEAAILASHEDYGPRLALESLTKRSSGSYTMDTADSPMKVSRKLAW